MEKNKKRLAAAVLAVLALAGCASRGGPEAPGKTEVGAPAVSSPLSSAAGSPQTAAPVPAQVPEPEDADFVRVQTYIPSLYVDLKYAGEDNFTGTAIYDFSDAYLRYGTVKKLAAAQELLTGQGCSLLIWDAFRPTTAQFRLWEICPDPVYVANPEKGFSSHSRGNTVDVTLVTAEGAEMEMPTGFDDFSAKADRDYADVSETAAFNARLLEDTLVSCGFRPYSGEWWHFSDTEDYPVEETFTP